MKQILILSLIILSIQSFADQRSRVKDQISDLALQIDQEIYNSDASTDELRRAKMKIREALEKITGRGSDYSSCVDFALPIFERRYTGATAVRKAKEICKSVADARVFEYFYEKLSVTYIDTTALRKAAELSDSTTVGKKSIIEFSYEKHETQYTANRAIDKALENARILRASSLRCLERFYSTFSRSYSASRAMDMTAENCSEN